MTLSTFDISFVLAVKNWLRMVATPLRENTFSFQNRPGHSLESFHHFSHAHYTFVVHMQRPATPAPPASRPQRGPCQQRYELRAADKTFTAHGPLFSAHGPLG
jgi:hypothetical protein